MLVLGGVGFLCVIAIVAGLGSLFGLGGPTSTTSADYTTNEVREIIRLLREDEECRDTRIGDYFSRHYNSLELWERVLGKPSVVVGREYSPDWTFKTSDGALTVHVRVDSHSGDIPFVVAYSNGSASVGVNSNQPVDTAALKKTILSIKRRFDDRDGVEFAAQLNEKWAEERAAEEAEGRRRDAQEQTESAERYARQKAEREAELARRRAAQSLEDAKVAERKRFLEAQSKAGDDFYDNLCGYFPVKSSERSAVAKQADGWIARRTKVLVAARKKGNVWKHLPLPTKETVSAAISDGKPIPVVDTVATNPVTTTPQKPGKKTSGKNSRGKVAAKKTESQKVATKRKAPPTTQPKKPTTKTRKRRVAKPRNAAITKKVSLTAPYPSSYKGAPRDKLSVQYAVIEIVKQVGLRYDFKTSYANTNPICRRWVRPRIRNQTYQKALVSILRPVGLTYRITDGTVILKRR